MAAALMGEVLEDHIRHHMMSGERAETKAVAEDVIDLVRAYLK